MPFRPNKQPDPDRTTLLLHSEVHQNKDVAVFVRRVWSMVGHWTYIHDSNKKTVC
jgi:hypothetical protein